MVPSQGHPVVSRQTNTTTYIDLVPIIAPAYLYMYRCTCTCTCMWFVSIVNTVNVMSGTKLQIHRVVSDTRNIHIHTQNVCAHTHTTTIMQI